ncbi:hypothetical protein PO909_020316 [Leuciscus waleckii]
MATRDRHSACGSSDHVSVNEVNVDTEPSPSTREQVFAKLQKESSPYRPLGLLAGKWAGAIRGITNLHGNARDLAGRYALTISDSLTNYITLFQETRNSSEPHTHLAEQHLHKHICCCMECFLKAQTHFPEPVSELVMHK